MPFIQGPTGPVLYPAAHSLRGSRSPGASRSPFWRLLASSLALLIALPAVADHLPHDTVVIATGAWDPYVEINPGLEIPEAEPGTRTVEPVGPLVDIVRRAHAAAGLDVQFVSHPWTRNAQLVESGEVDAAMPYYCSEKRAKTYICSNPIVSGEQVFFHRRGLAFAWTDVESLAGYNIGATLGYFYGEAFETEEALGKLNVKRNAKDEVNLTLLMNGRIDLFPQDRAVGYAMIRRVLPPEEWHSITHHPRTLHRESLHLVFTRANERGLRFSRLFNRELERMQASGELAALLRPISEAGRSLSAHPRAQP